MRHIWSVVCRHALEDKDSRNFSLIEALVQLSFGGAIPDSRPIPLPLDFHIASLWRRDEKHEKSEYDTRVRLISPSGDNLLEIAVPIDFKGSDSHRTNIDLNHFPYTTDGLYEFEVSYFEHDMWVIATSVPVKVAHEERELARAERA